MNNLVFYNNNKVLTSSRTISVKFNKEHKNVLRDIRNVIKNMGSNLSSPYKAEDYFIESTYKDAYNRDKTEYLLTKDGFSLLVMGYNGPKALKFKLDYIAAYNSMEQSFIKLKEENLELRARLAEHDKEVLERSLDRTIQALEDTEYKCNKLEEHYEELRQYNKEWVAYADDLEKFIREKIYA